MMVHMDDTAVSVEQYECVCCEQNVQNVAVLRTRQNLAEVFPTASAYVSVHSWTAIRYSLSSVIAFNTTQWLVQLIIVASFFFIGELLSGALRYWRLDAEHSYLLLSSKPQPQSAATWCVQHYRVYCSVAVLTTWRQTSLSLAFLQAWCMAKRKYCSVSCLG